MKKGGMAVLKPAGVELQDIGIVKYTVVLEAGSLQVAGNFRASR